MAIYQGETIPFLGQFKNDDNTHITDLTPYTITANVYCKQNANTIVIGEEDMTITGGIISFKVSSTDSQNLIGWCTFEIKLDDGTNVRIGQKNVFEVLPSRIGKNKQPIVVNNKFPYKFPLKLS